MNKKKELYLRIQSSPYLPGKIKQRVYDYREGIWETPKVYIDGYAYNDGSWLIYNTCRISCGKFKNKVYCRTRKDMIDNLYSYICFLKNIGMDNTLEMGYFAFCHIIVKLTFTKGLFAPTKQNLDLLECIIQSIRKNDICCYRKDTRKYCMDPRMKEGKTTGQKVGLQRKKDKEVTWKRIEELYDETLTNKQNLLKMKEAGLPICERTLQEWKKSHRGCKMDFDDTFQENDLY